MLKILNRDLLSNPMYVINKMQGFHTFVSKNPVCFSDGSMSIGRKELFQTCMLTQPRKERKACVPGLRL